MSFKDIVGQDRAIRRIQQMVSVGKLPHALLFFGEDGIGKKLTAINLAKLVNCHNGKNDCCDECSSCKKVDAKVHPDVHLVEGRTTIGIEAVRQMARDAWLSAHGAGWKVWIVDSAELMTPEAANAALKLLEDPPSKCLFILVSSLPETLPATLRSRCVEVGFSTVPYNDILGLLKTTVDDMTKAQLAAALANGSVGRAFAMLRSDSLISSRKQAIRLIESIGDLKFRQERAGGDLGILMAKIGSDLSAREKASEFLHLLHCLLRDMIFIKLGARAKLLNADIALNLESLAQNWELEGLIGALQSTYSAAGALKRYGNPRLVIEALVVELFADAA